MSTDKALKDWKGEGHFICCSTCGHHYFPEAFEAACPHKSFNARADRLTAAQEGVVEALRTFAREVEFLREQGELMNDDDRIGRPLSATKSATRLILVNLLDARTALDELKEAQK